MKRWFFVLGSMLLLAGTVEAQGEVKKEKPKSGGANVITQAEIEYVGVGNAYEVIQRLRPNMLRRRMGSSLDKGEGGEIVVFMDNAKYGLRTSWLASRRIVLRRSASSTLPMQRPGGAPTTRKE